MKNSNDSQYANLSGGEWVTAGTSALGAIMGGVQTKAQIKIAKANAEAQAKADATQYAIAQLGLEQARINASAVSKGDTSSNKNLYIALGIGGVVVLGIVIFAVTRK